MIHKEFAIIMLSLAALAVGCDKDQTDSRQIGEVEARMRESAQDIKAYTFAQRAEFTEKMKDQLVEINKDLDQLDATIEKSSDAVRTESRPKLQALRVQEAELKKQLDGVKDATDSTWDSVRSGAEKAYAALNEGFQQSRQWASDKLAP